MTEAPNPMLKQAKTKKAILDLFHDGQLVPAANLARVALEARALKERVDLLEEGIHDLRGKDVPKRDAEDCGEAYDLAIDDVLKLLRTTLLRPSRGG